MEQAVAFFVMGALKSLGVCNCGVYVFMEVVVYLLCPGPCGDSECFVDLVKGTPNVRLNVATRTHLSARISYIMRPASPQTGQWTIIPEWATCTRQGLDKVLTISLCIDY